MTEPATVSIWSLIDFFPHVDGWTGWRCRLCPTSPDRPATRIVDSPRWTVASDDGWAQREARNHLAQQHQITFTHAAP